MSTFIITFNWVTTSLFLLPFFFLKKRKKVGNKHKDGCVSLTRNTEVFHVQWDLREDINIFMALLVNSDNPDVSTRTSFFGSTIAAEEFHVGPTNSLSYPICMWCIVDLREIAFQISRHQLCTKLREWHCRWKMTTLPSPTSLSRVSPSHISFWAWAVGTTANQTQNTSSYNGQGVAQVTKLWYLYAKYFGHLKIF